MYNIPIDNNVVQALYFGLHCSAIEVTTLWFISFYSVNSYDIL